LNYSNLICAGIKSVGSL